MDDAGACSNENKYCDKTLEELKKCLRDEGLKVCGKKKTLIERLLFHDRVSTKDDPLPEFHMSLPDAELYKDLHSDHLQNFPKVTDGRLLDFLATCGKSFDKKTQLLYEQRYVRNIRSASSDNKVYVSSAIWAEMKKSISYRVDISFDQCGVVLQSQCECAVGQGPSAHCKHVGCTLYAVTKFGATGNLLTEVTCTQRLQTFHKPQAHTGSPLKTKNLDQARGREKPFLYDPRAVNKRNPAKREDDLRSAVLNWQGARRWPVMQKYNPANIKAVAADHDYMELTMEMHFLQQQKISKITKKDVDEIERNTRGQSSCASWMYERSKRMTSSNFGKICKRTDRRDEEGLVRGWLGKSFVSCDSIRRGQKYERVAIEKFEQETGTMTIECGLFVSLSHPMLAASPDRIVDEDTLVEVKCPYSSRDLVITEKSVPYLTLKDGQLTLKKGHDYYYQIQGQLFCTNRKLCKFVVFTFKDLKVIDIHFDHDFVQPMVSKLKEFYENVYRQALIQRFFYKDANFFYK